jgi:hypothetical protein
VPKSQVNTNFCLWYCVNTFLSHKNICSMFILTQSNDSSVNFNFPRLQLQSHRLSVH